MNITMIGTGYVGLVTGTCFAEFGFNVTCVDNNPAKIATLNQGGIPIYEPGLDNLVAKNVKAKRLQFTTNLPEAVREADLVFIAVGTPPGKDGHADLSYLFAAVEELAPHLTDYTVIVDKSTVPVGTGRKVAEIIRTANPQADFDVVSNPEFLREGNAIEDFMRPDRVVLGVESPRAAERMRTLYLPLESQNIPLLMTGLETAELIKYAANAFLATKISFINEMARLAEAVGADVTQVADGMGLDNRIGRAFLNPGPGYGGSCFPKDTLAIAKTARDHKTPLSVVEAVIDANHAQRQAMVDKVVRHLGSVKGKTIAVLGLAFKANTDDMRDAPALDIVPLLQKQGAHIKAFDPQAMAHAKDMLPKVDMMADIPSTLKGADCALILTEWREFSTLTAADFMALKTPTVVDLRNLFNPTVMAEAGLTYHSLGRPTVEAHSHPQAANG